MSHLPCQRFRSSSPLWAPRCGSKSWSRSTRP